MATIICKNSIMVVEPVAEKKPIKKSGQLWVALVFAYDQGTPWSGNLPLIGALEDMGHDVDLINVYNDQAQYDFDNLNTLIRGRNEYDFVLVLDIGCIQDERVHTRNFPCPVIGEMGDDPQRHILNLNCAPQYDALLTPCWGLINRYKVLGWKETHWFPHFYDHEEHKLYDVDPEFDVVTSMNVYGRRQATLKMLEESEFSFSNRTGIYGEEYSRHLQNGRIVFNQSNHNELTRRIFEAMAGGRLVLTDKIPKESGLYRLFKPGVHFDEYSNEAELKEKIGYYLKNGEEREKIARAGYNAVQAHSARARAKQIVEIYRGL